MKASARVAALAAPIVVGAVLAGPAAGGFTPAWSYVPAPLRARLAAKLGGELFLPARTPLFYRYRSGAAVAGGALAVPFTDRVRVRQGVWRWTSKTFVWRVEPLRRGAGCAAWARRSKTLQLSGNEVFWSSADGIAWRCVGDSRGRRLVLSASGESGLPDTGLGRVVASGLDVAGRSDRPRVALTVFPAAVARGGSVLVRGLADGCAAGDRVTIISRAFPATHGFAGVPAVFAEVGAAGRFSTRVRIPLARARRSYLVTARCGGGNLGVVAHLRVG